LSLPYASQAVELKHIRSHRVWSIEKLTSSV